MAGILPVVSNGLHILLWFDKSVRVASALKETVNEVQQEGVTLRALTNTVFIAAQTTEIGCVVQGVKATSNIRFGARVIAGASDFGRQAARDGFTVDTAARAAFRTADVINGAIEGEFICEHAEAAKQATEILSQVGIVIEKRNDIYKAGRLVYEFMDPVIAYVFSRKKDEEGKVQEPDKGWEEALKQLKTQHNIIILSEIPRCFHSDKVLGEFVCPITKKPVRFVATPRGIIGDSDPVYYERSALEQWFKKSPNKPPPKWPEKSRGFSFEECKPIQALIDRRLRTLEQEFSETIPILAKEADLRYRRLNSDSV